MIEDFPPIHKDLKILALAGRRYSGKSTVGQAILKVDTRFRKASFAQALKAEYAQNLDLPDPDMWTNNFKEKHRQGLIDFSLVKKKDDRYYFAKKLFASVQNGEYILIDDLRFIEELELCLQRDAVVFKVYSDPHLRRERGWIYNREIDEDFSETELDLPGQYFYDLTKGKGGVIYNTRKDDNYYLGEQLAKIIAGYFPQCVGPDHPDVEKLKRSIK
jgi:phosphomevalonate kinase